VIAAAAREAAWLRASRDQIYASEKFGGERRQIQLIHGTRDIEFTAIPRAGRRPLTNCIGMTVLV